MRVLGTAVLTGHRSMNPCPVYDEFTGTLFLFFIAVLGHTSESYQLVTGKNVTRLCYICSTDDGDTWTGVTDLTNRVIGDTIKGRRIQNDTLCLSFDFDITSVSAFLFPPCRMGHFCSWSGPWHPAEVRPPAHPRLRLPHRVQGVLRSPLPDQSSCLLLSQWHPWQNLAIRGGGSGPGERGVSDGVCWWRGWN